MLKPTKILVPTDFSEYSDKALKQALDIAKQYNAKVYLFHAIHEETQRIVLDFVVNAEEVEDIEKRHAAAARAMMERQLKKFPGAEAIEVHIEVGKGNPFEAILDEEQKKGIDLIVIASLGRTGLAKYFIGNVARNVLKGATAPVLLTR